MTSGHVGILPNSGFYSVLDKPPAFLRLENRVLLETLAQRIQFCLYPIRDWNVWQADDKNDVVALLVRGKDALDELMELLQDE